MNPFMRRRAERFAKLVADQPDRDRTGPDANVDQGTTNRTAAGPDRAGQHQVRGGHHTRDADDTLALLVRVSGELSRQRETFDRAHRMDSDSRAEIRRRLLADAAVHGIGAARSDAEPDTDTSVRSAGTPRPTHHAVPPNRRPRVRLIVVGGVVAGALGISGVAAASTTAVPGDALYNVKRSTERAQIALAGSNGNSGELYLQFARTRAAEAGSVSDDIAELTRVLGDMDRETRQGVALLGNSAVADRTATGLDRIDSFTSAQRPVVSRLVARLTGDPHIRAQRSLDLIDRVTHRSAALRRLLLCTAGRTVRHDALGPVPQTCATLPGGKPDPSGAGQGSGQGTQQQSSGQPSPSGSAGRASQRPSAGPSGTTQPSPTESGVPTPTPPPGGDSGNGGILEKIGKILGGLV